MAENKNNTKTVPNRRKGKTRSKGKYNPRDFKKDEKVVSPSKDNDASWYLVNNQMASDVASFSFNTPLGDRILLRGNGGTSEVYEGRLPGIMAIYTSPSVGISTNHVDAVNLAAKDIYSFVRHANSGHANYDPADLMIYLLANDSIFSFWSWMTRLYGLMNVFSQTNRYIGDAMIKAQYVNPVDLRSNMAQFRAYINQFAVKASTLAVPNTMKYFIKHAWMYQNVYRDEDNEKSQFYLYAPAFFYTYGVHPITGAGMLTPHFVASTTPSMIRPTITGNTKTFANIKTIGDTLINNLMTQEDIGIISGDILKAYGSDKLWRFESIPNDYAVVPVFSDEVLAQIHNTSFMGNRLAYVSITETGEEIGPGIFNALNITQDTSVGGGFLNFRPLALARGELQYDKIIDFWKPNPTPEDVLVGTRNSLVGFHREMLSNEPVEEFLATGSEIAYFANLIELTGANSAGAGPSFVETPIGTSGSNVGNAAAKLSVFNEYPIGLDITDGTTVNGIVGEMSNYTTVSEQEMHDMHVNALLGLFGVPYRV